MATQRVVIPKGLVNPNETTIVEIPSNLQNVGTVVARPRENSPFSPSTPARMPNKKSYLRKTLPRAAPKTYAHLHEAGTTFGGRPYEEESSVEESPYKFPQPHAPGWCYASLSPGDVSYAVCRRGGRIGFEPPCEPHLSSTFGDIDYRETTLYRDFRPKQMSSHPSTPVREPGSMKHWHSSLGTVSPDMSQEQSGDYEYTEESIPCYEYSPVPMPAVDSSGSPVAEGSSGNYRRYDSSDSSGGNYRRYDSSDSSGGLQIPGAVTPRKITQREVMNSLGELEAVELSQIMGDLNMFQNARRRLVFDASSLASAADVSTSLLSSSG